MKKYVVYSEKQLSNGKYGKEKRLRSFRTHTNATYFIEELKAYEKEEGIRFFMRYE